MGTEDEVNVDFMFKKSTTLYVTSESLQCSAVELPYAGGELSFVAILPHAVDGLPALEQRLDVTSLLEQLLVLILRKCKTLDKHLLQVPANESEKVVVILLCGDLVAGLGL